jgi:biotin operon repressor
LEKGELDKRKDAAQVQLDILLPFFKALADANRLKIIGLLARGEPLSGEQLAEMLELSPSTVSHHLTQLARVGLVSARAESYYNIYRLETEALEQVARRLLQRETLAVVADSVDVDAYDRKVLANFIDAKGRVHTFPAQRKKLEVILRYVLGDFQPGVRYSEKQVNEILGRYHADTATLRRELIEIGWLKREGDGSVYWLPQEGSERNV